MTVVKAKAVNWSGRPDFLVGSMHETASSGLSEESASQSLADADHTRVVLGASLARPTPTSLGALQVRGVMGENHTEYLLRGARRASIYIGNGIDLEFSKTP